MFDKTSGLAAQIVAEMRSPEWRDALAPEFVAQLQDEACVDWDAYCDRQASGRTWGSTMELRVAQVLFGFEAVLYEEHLLVSCTGSHNMGRAPVSPLLQKAVAPSLQGL